MNISPLKQLITISTLSLSALLATGANAEAVYDQGSFSQVVETQSISVPYSSNELTTQESREALYRKISRAAEKVCGPTSSRDAGGIKFASRNRDCYEDAMAAAISQVKDGQLAGVYQ